MEEGAQARKRKLFQQPDRSGAELITKLFLQQVKTTSQEGKSVLTIKEGSILWVQFFFSC
jgi:hypothetical protein